MNPKNFLDQEVKRSGLPYKEWYWNVYLQSDHWKELRARKLKEAKYKCQCCGKARPLDVHHNNYRSIYDVKLSDLLAVCRRCHNAIDKYMKTMKSRLKNFRK